MVERLLDAFSRWFGSSWGVVETALFAAAAIALEVADPHVDPHWFWLLVIWTIYSGVTQPALAFGNEKASRLILDVLQELRKIARHIEALLDHHGVEKPN